MTTKDTFKLLIVGPDWRKPTDEYRWTVDSLYEGQDPFYILVFFHLHVSGCYCINRAKFILMVLLSTNLNPNSCLCHRPIPTARKVDFWGNVCRDSILMMFGGRRRWVSQNKTHHRSIHVSNLQFHHACCCACSWQNFHLRFLQCKLPNVDSSFSKVCRSLTHIYVSTEWTQWNRKKLWPFAHTTLEYHDLHWSIGQSVRRF